MNDLNEFEGSKEAFWEFTLKVKINFNFKINSKVKLENFSISNRNTIFSFFDILFLLKLS